MVAYILVNGVLPDIEMFCKNVCTEETFGSAGFESIFKHLEIISNGRPIKVLYDRIDISKSKSLDCSTVSLS